MFQFLYRFFGPRIIEIAKHEPEIRGHLHLELRERGKLVAVRDGYNIWTLTGREFLSEGMALRSINPTREVYRSDRVAFIGVGVGAQPEVSNIKSLVDPVPYRSGQFLARLATPPTFPVTGVDAARTAVQFTREFARSEISLGYTVAVSEFGLFTDGDPDNNWDITTTPTSFDLASGRAPVAYKTVEPVSKTTAGALRAVWEVRII